MIIWFCEFRRRETFQFVSFFHSHRFLLYYQNSWKTNMKWNEKFFALFNQIRTKFFFESITQDLPFFHWRTLFLISSFSNGKYSRSESKKKTRDLDFLKHVTCVLQFLSSHELLIGCYVLWTFQVRLIRKIIYLSLYFQYRNNNFYWTFPFFSFKYINNVRSTIYSAIYRYFSRKK